MRLTRWEATVLALLAAWSLGPLVALLWEAIRDGGTLTGADGPFAADQLQYLSWIREAGDHGLASNRFDVAPSDHVFAHPMFLLSGVAWKLGAGIQLAYLAWKPVAIAVLFAGAALYVRRTVEAPGARTAALVLALFFFTPAGAAMPWLGVGSPEAQGQVQNLAGEMFAAGQLWGYLPTAIALGLMPVFVLGLERLLEGRRGRTTAWTAAAGALVSWLHPWQGVTLLLLAAGLIAWERAGARPERAGRPAAAALAPAAAVVAATALPIAYYLVLGHADGAWEVARRQNEEPGLPVWTIFLALLPLAAFAPLAAGRVGARPADRALVLWPVAALVVYALVASTRYHAFEGIALPLAILAVRAGGRLRLAPAVAAGLVALAVVPGSVRAAEAMRDFVRADLQPHVLAGGEARALDHVRESPRPGSVLANNYLASAIPALTGRATFVGHPSWTPGFEARAGAVAGLFAGALPAPRARAYVRETGAALVVTDCRDPGRLAAQLAPDVARTRRFGCAAVLELAAPGRR